MIALIHIKLICLLYPSDLSWKILNWRYNRGNSYYYNCLLISFSMFCLLNVYLISHTIMLSIYMHGNRNLSWKQSRHNTWPIKMMVKTITLQGDQKEIFKLLWFTRDPTSNFGRFHSHWQILALSRLLTSVYCTETVLQAAPIHYYLTYSTKITN